MFPLPHLSSRHHFSSILIIFLVSGGFGFGAYSKINPFAAVTASGSLIGSGTNSGIGSGLGSGIGSGISSSSSTFGSSGASVFGTGGSVTGFGIGSSSSFFSPTEELAPAPVPASVTAPAATFGFGAYANTNPFAAVTASVPLFTAVSTPAPSSAPSGPSGSSEFPGILSGPSNPLSNSFSSAVPHSAPSSFGFPSSGYNGKNSFAAPLKISVSTANENNTGVSGVGSEPFGTNASTSNSSTTTTFGATEGMERPSSFSSMPTNGTSFSSYTTKAPFAVIIPSPLTLSPKAQNPFSNPSPKHNPFVTIVESKDNLWSKSSSGTCASASGGTSSFPFPSSGAISSKAVGTSAIVGVSNGVNVSNGVAGGAGGSGLVASGGIGVGDGEKCERTSFGTISSSALKSSGNGNGEEDEGNRADEYVEDQVYGKVYPMPDNVTVVTGEEHEDCVIQIRAKLFRLSVPSDDNSPEKKNTSSSGNLLDLIGQSNDSNSSNINSNVKDPANGHTIAENKESQLENSQISQVSVLDNTESAKDLKIPKKKSLGEWIEVGIGPVRILKERENSRTDSSSSVVSNSSSNKRMVMRREDKKGGKGKKFAINLRIESSISAFGF